MYFLYFTCTCTLSTFSSTAKFTNILSYTIVFLFFLKVTYLESRSVQCKCGNSFCFACYKDIHEPINCEMLKIWEKKSNDDSETCKWISVHTKDCPKCFTPIEKNGGCNHMSCKTTTCLYQFCWLCMKKWGSCNYDCNK